MGRRLFAKQQDHRSKRFARSATLANAGYPGDPPSHHPGHHHHHHVVFASTSLEVSDTNNNKSGRLDESDRMSSRKERTAIGGNVFIDRLMCLFLTLLTFARFRFLDVGAKNVFCNSNFILSATHFS